MDWEVIKINNANDPLAKLESTRQNITSSVF